MPSKPRVLLAAAVVALLTGLAAADDEEKFMIYTRSGATLEWARQEGSPGRLRVKDIEKKSLARELGYREGDEIVAIGGEPAAGKTLREFILLPAVVTAFRVLRNKTELELPALFRSETILYSSPHELKPGQRAPALEVKLPEGKWNLLDEAAGKVVLINFWAVWCEPCLAELPDLVRLQDQYRSQGVVVYCVNLDNDADTLKKYLKENPLPLPIIRTGGFKGEAASRYRIHSIPVNVLVDREGFIAQVGLGYSAKHGQTELSSAIETLLQAQTPPLAVVPR